MPLPHDPSSHPRCPRNRLLSSSLLQHVAHVGHDIEVCACWSLQLTGEGLGATNRAQLSNLAQFHSIRSDSRTLRLGNFTKDAWEAKVKDNISDLKAMVNFSAKQGFKCAL